MPCPFGNCISMCGLNCAFRVCDSMPSRPVDIEMDKKDTPKITHLNLAAVLPVEGWVEPGLKHLRLAWVTRWAATGLMPVRPVIVMGEAVTIPAGKVLKLF